MRTNKGKIVKSLPDLLEYFDADDIKGLFRRVYKDTDCGAHISLYGMDRFGAVEIHAPGRVLEHTDLDLADDMRREEIDEASLDELIIYAFQLGSIVEGLDDGVSGTELHFGRVTNKDIDKELKWLEAECERLWNEANEAEVEA